MSVIDSQVLYNQLLRPPILHILRATGFTRTRPAVLETLLDLTSRYLTLLAYQTAQHARHRQDALEAISFPIVDHSPPTITITDVREALQDVGLLQPQIGELEERYRIESTGDEDLRGVDDFIAWCHGDVNAEIRRVAGMNANLTEDSAAAAAVGKPSAAMATVPGSTAIGVLPTSAQQQQDEARSQQQRQYQQQPTPQASQPSQLQQSFTASQPTLTHDPHNDLSHPANPTIPSSALPTIVPGPIAAAAIEDYLTTLKRKHISSKIGEESRWQGTILGKAPPPIALSEDFDADAGAHTNNKAGRGNDGTKGGREMVIEGWDQVEGLRDWGGWVKRNRRNEDTGRSGLRIDTAEGRNGNGNNNTDNENPHQEGAERRGSESSSPLSEIGGSGSGSD